MNRFLVEGLKPGVSRLELADEEAHHVSVRRVDEERDVELRDGRGAIGIGRIHRNGRRAWVEVRDVQFVAPPVKAALLVGAGDRERFTWLVEKATELGATDVIPIATERSENVATRLRPEHQSKLERRALEVLKQSGGAWAPAIHPIVSLAEGLESTPPTAIRWICDVGGAGPGSISADQTVALLVGPEGGLTERELALCIDARFTRVRLARDILRFETAAVAGLAIVAANRAR